MLYNTQSSYYKQFLVNNGNASKKLEKMLKKGQAEGQQTSEKRAMQHPGSVGC